MRDFRSWPWQVNPVPCSELCNGLIDIESRPVMYPNMHVARFSSASRRSIPQEWSTTSAGWPKYSNLDPGGGIPASVIGACPSFADKLPGAKWQDDDEFAGNDASSAFTAESETMLFFRAVMESSIWRCSSRDGSLLLVMERRSSTGGIKRPEKRIIGSEGGGWWSMLSWSAGWRRCKVKYRFGGRIRVSNTQHQWLNQESKKYNDGDFLI